MSLKKYLLASGLSTALVLGACNGDTEEDTSDEGTEEDAVDETEDEGNEESTETTEEGGDASYSGEYGDYSIIGYDQVAVEDAEAEEAAEEEEGEESGPTEIVLVEFEFTNNSDVPTSASEAFGMDLAVRQIAEAGESTLDNLTMDLPEDHEKSEEISASSELIEPGESVTAVVGYGPLDTSLETVLQSREDPMGESDSEPLDETIEIQSEE